MKATFWDIKGLQNIMGLAGDWKDMVGHTPGCETYQYLMRIGHSGTYHELRDIPGHAGDFRTKWDIPGHAGDCRA